jgi:8-oxo-dGTP diphosphatase
LRLESSSLVEAGFAYGRSGDEDTGIVILLYTADRWTGLIEAREGGEFAWFEPDRIACLVRPPLDVILCRQLFGAAS